MPGLNEIGCSGRPPHPHCPLPTCSTGRLTVTSPSLRNDSSPSITSCTSATHRSLRYRWRCAILPRPAAYDGSRPPVRAHDTPLVMAHLRHAGREESPYFGDCAIRDHLEQFRRVDLCDAQIPGPALRQQHRMRHTRVIDLNARKLVCGSAAALGDVLPCRSRFPRPMGCRCPGFAGYRLHPAQSPYAHRASPRPH